VFGDIISTLYFLDSSESSSSPRYVLHHTLPSLLSDPAREREDGWGRTFFIGVYEMRSQKTDLLVWRVLLNVYIVIVGWWLREELT